MADGLAGLKFDASSPARAGFTVTPNDSTALAVYSRALYVGVGGDVSVDMAGDGVTLVFKSVPSGTMLPISVMRVRTATTATNILALY